MIRVAFCGHMPAFPGDMIISIGSSIHRIYDIQPMWDLRFALNLWPIGKGNWWWSIKFLSTLLWRRLEKKSHRLSSWKQIQWDFRNNLRAESRRMRNEGVLNFYCAFFNRPNAAEQTMKFFPFLFLFLSKWCRGQSPESGQLAWRFLDHWWCEHVNMPCSGCTEASAKKGLLIRHLLECLGILQFFNLSPIATLIGDSELNNHDSDGY